MELHGLKKRYESLPIQRAYPTNTFESHTHRQILEQNVNKMRSSDLLRMNNNTRFVEKLLIYDGKRHCQSWIISNGRLCVRERRERTNVKMKLITAPPKRPNAICSPRWLPNPTLNRICASISFKLFRMCGYLVSFVTERTYQLNKSMEY